MPRLLRALRLMRLVAQLPFQGELLSFLGIAKQVAAVLMLGHWIGCLWWLLQDSQDKVAAAHQFEGGSWLIINGYVLPDGTLQIDFPETYLLSFSAALYMLVGNTDGAVTTAEKVYAATMMIVGTFVTACMVSQLGVFLAQINGTPRPLRAHSKKRRFSA
jgi:hypothetical protein